MAIASHPSKHDRTDPEAIAFRVHQIADTAAVLAEAAALPDSHGEQLAGALYLIEASMLDVERRVERLRPVPG